MDLREIASQGVDCMTQFHPMELMMMSLAAWPAGASAGAAHIHVSEGPAEPFAIAVLDRKGLQRQTLLRLLNPLMDHNRGIDEVEGVDQNLRQRSRRSPPCPGSQNESGEY